MTDPSLGETEATSATTSAIPVQKAGSARTSVGRASAILASGTLVSRVLGFVNAAVLAHAIGTFAAADAFSLANQLPNNIYSLVAGGLLSAVIVPQIVKAGLHDDGGQRFVNRLVTLGVSLFIPITVVAVLCAPLLTRLYGAGRADEATLQLATLFAYWCLPQILFYALYSLVGETLNARGVFGPFTWAPVVNNVVVIGGTVLFMSLFGGDPAHRDPAGWSGAEISLLGAFTTGGIAAQALVLFLFWRRAGLRFRPDFRWRGVGLGDTGRAAAWVFGIFLVSQVGGVVETNVALSASGENQASVTVLRYAWLMFMLPHSVATVSIVTAYFTRMSEHVRDGDLPSVRRDLVSALRLVLLIMVFSAVGLAVLAYPFSALVLPSYDSIAATAPVYMAYLLGLVSFTVFFVLLRVYYALDLVRVAFFIQIAQTAFYCLACLLIDTLVPDRWVAIALALALGAALTLQAVLSALFLVRPLGGVGTREVTLQGLWFLGAALPAAAAGVGLLALLGGVSEGAFPVSSPVGGAVTMVIAGGVMAVVYAAVLWVTRNPELRAAAAPVLGRLRRR
ncbi:MAG TPA: murein biosynthesis integral membrane protein MurJ [Rhodoglobus sp.]|nr:murein biosynthesis integral membrane protein MurJ [Rhodoglobus sp.]